MSADDRAERAILRAYRKDEYSDQHLAKCDSTKVVAWDEVHSTCGEGTCDYYLTSGDVECEHGYTSEFDFALLDVLIDMMEREEEDGD